jgi:hypothetical protein
MCSIPENVLESDIPRYPASHPSHEVTCTGSVSVSCSILGGASGYYKVPYSISSPQKKILRVTKNDGAEAYRYFVKKRLDIHYPQNDCGNIIHAAMVICCS